MSFEYIKDYYKVPAEIHREVIVDGKKGVIVGAKDQYLSVSFYHLKGKFPLPCHPTWEVKYLDTFNKTPPKIKNRKSKERYNHYLSIDSSMTFFEYLKSDWVLK